MPRARRRLIGLLAIVVVLAAVTAWQFHRDHAERTLLAINPASITRIDITRHGQPTRHFVKRDGHWYHAGATPGRADDKYVQTLVKLAATPVLQWRKVSDVDLARIGLKTPPVVVSLNGHKLAYGTLAAFGPQRFVLVGARVAVVAAAYSPRSPEPAASASASSAQKS